MFLFFLSSLQLYSKLCKGPFLKSPCNFTDPNPNLRNSSAGFSSKIKTFCLFTRYFYFLNFKIINIAIVNVNMTNKKPVPTETYKQRGLRSYSACSPVRINRGSLVVSPLSLSGCPNNEANQAKIFPKHSKSPVSKKTPHLSPTSISPPSVGGGVKGSASGSIISTRSSAR